MSASAGGSEIDMPSRLIRSLVAMLVVGAALIGVRAQPAEAPQPLVVHVTAERFAFTPSEITVSEGTVIEFRLTSEDTSHGFRILGQSVDIAIPKRGRGEITVRFTPPEPGSYVFEC